jgi:hypothetical protein
MWVGCSPARSEIREVFLTDFEETSIYLRKIPSQNVFSWLVGLIPKRFVDPLECCCSVAAFFYERNKGWSVHFPYLGRGSSFRSPALLGSSLMSRIEDLKLLLQSLLYI